MKHDNLRRVRLSWIKRDMVRCAAKMGRKSPVDSTAARRISVGKEKSADGAATPISGKDKMI